MINMQKYQVNNPNNARIFIDYRKDKDKVKFEFVDNQDSFKIVYDLAKKIFYRFGLIWLFVFAMAPSMIAIVFYSSYDISLKFLIILFLMYSTYILLPLISALIIKNTRLIKITPYLYAFGIKRNYVEFHPEHIIDGKVEIPLFSNVSLHYKAYGDFAEGLAQVEIVEHPFNYLVKEKKEWKKKPNPYLWKAIFYCDKEIKEGVLKVVFS